MLSLFCLCRSLPYTCYKHNIARLTKKAAIRKEWGERVKERKERGPVNGEGGQEGTIKGREDLVKSGRDAERELQGLVELR